MQQLVCGHEGVAPGPGKVAPSFHGRNLGDVSQPGINVDGGRGLVGGVELTRSSRKQLEAEAETWRRLSDAVGLVWRLT